MRKDVPRAPATHLYLGLQFPLPQDAPCALLLQAAGLHGEARLVQLLQRQHRLPVVRRDAALPDLDVASKYKARTYIDMYCIINPKETLCN